MNVPNFFKQIRFFEKVAVSWMEWSCPRERSTRVPEINVINVDNSPFLRRVVEGFVVVWIRIAITWKFQYSGLI